MEHITFKLSKNLSVSGDDIEHALQLRVETMERRDLEDYWYSMMRQYYLNKADTDEIRDLLEDEGII